MWERKEESTVAMAATCTVIESACVFVSMRSIAVDASMRRHCVIENRVG